MIAETLKSKEKKEKKQSNFDWEKTVAELIGGQNLCY